MSLPPDVVRYKGTASTRVKDRDRGPDNAYIQGVWKIVDEQGDHVFLAPIGPPYDSVCLEPTHVIKLESA